MVEPWNIGKTKRGLASGLLVLIVASGCLRAQEQRRTWEGYLTDAMCALRWRGKLADTYAKRHTKSCAYHDECRESGED